MTGTTRTLDELLADRQRAWNSMSNRALCDLSTEERAQNERAAERFRAADALIVDELRRRDQPTVVTIRGVAFLLHLTSDRLGFATCDAKTGRPQWNGSGDAMSVLYRYPALEAAS